MEEQLELFADLNLENTLNPMIRLFGTGPQGTSCGSCVHMAMGDGSLFCRLRGEDCTDHRKAWQSCRKYAPQETE